MPDRLADALDTVRRRVPGVTVVYLFGSAEAGTAGLELDLAVLAGRPLGAAERCDVDLVDLRAASTVM